HLILFAGHLLRCLTRRLALCAAPSGRIRRRGIAERLTEPIREIALLLRQPVRTVLQIAELGCGLLLPEPVQHVSRFLQTLRGPARIGFRLLILSLLLRLLLRRPHILGRLIQPVESLLQPLLSLTAASRQLPGLAALLSALLLAVLRRLLSVLLR